MIKLINLSNHEYDTSRFNNDGKEVSKYLDKINMDAIELIYCSPWQEGVLPKEKIKGVHLSFYPFWIDMWKGDLKALKLDFDNLHNAKEFYDGSLNRKHVVDKYRKEIENAMEIGAEYVVFHVAHVSIKESYTYDFEHSDEEIVDCALELINEALEGIEPKITFLVENLWWPGFTFLNIDLVEKIYKGINYSKKGFMLDTAHLINTNLNLQSEDEAIDYCIDIINSLGEYKNYIKGIHFNFSLSGEYTKNRISEGYEEEKTFKERYFNVFSHIGKIDIHKAFTSKRAREILELIKPEYLVYEFSSKDLQEHEKLVKTQNEALDF